MFLEKQKIFKGGFPSVVQGKSLSKIEQGTILNVVAFLENNCGCAFSDLSNQGRKPFHVILSRLCSIFIQIISVLQFGVGKCRLIKIYCTSWLLPSVVEYQY